MSSHVLCTFLVSINKKELNGLLQCFVNDVTLTENLTVNFLKLLTFLNDCDR